MKSIIIPKLKEEQKRESKWKKLLDFSDHFSHTRLNHFMAMICNDMQGHAQEVEERCETYIKFLRYRESDEDWDRSWPYYCEI